MRPIIALVFGFCFSPHILAADALRCEPASLDLGELRTGQTLGRQVTLKNAGLSSLEIIDLKGSCGCLRPNVAQRQVRAGGEVKLVLAIHTLSANAGDQLWNVQVRYRQDEREQTLTVPVRATVVQEVVVQPPLILVNSARPTRHDFTITDRRTSSFRVVKVEATSPHLSVGPVTEEKDAKGRVVRRFSMEITASLPAGRHEEQLVIHTDDSVHRELRVLVSITRRGAQRVEATPASLDVVAGASQQPLSRVVMLRELQGQALVVDRVEASHPALTGEITEVSNAVRGLKITIDPTRIDEEMLRCKVTVQFKAPAGESLVIPVTVLRR